MLASRLFQRMTGSYNFYILNLLFYILHLLVFHFESVNYISKHT